MSTTKKALTKLLKAHVTEYYYLLYSCFSSRLSIQNLVKILLRIFRKKIYFKRILSLKNIPQLLILLCDQRDRKIF